MSKCDCDYYEEDYCCEEKCCHDKGTRALVKCGSPSSASLPLGTLAGATFNVGTLTLDTRKFKNPCIKFDFSSNISTTAAVLTLNFQIFKQCKNQFNPTPVGAIWTFSRLVAVTDSNTFSFVVCDCDGCNDDCCTYTVVATVAGVATVGVTAINNATLSATVVDSNCDC